MWNLLPIGDSGWDGARQIHRDEYNKILNGEDQQLGAAVKEMLSTIKE